MKSQFSILLLLISFATLFTSCEEDFEELKEPPVGLGGQEWVEGPLDKWISDSLTSPYNVAINYRWDPTRVDMGFTVVPPDTSKVLTLLQGLTRVGFEPYNQQTGSKQFLKKYLPKNFVLLGSAQWLPNGTIILGQAEGGTEIRLMEVNYFSNKKSDSLIIKRVIKTIHHEMAHILNQNVYYDRQYQTIATGYTGTWFNISQQEALSKGFITPYAMASPDEDFVEMISVMLSEGKSEYEKLLQRAGSDGYTKLKAKEAMVIDYMKEVFDIDMYSLQEKCRQALNNFMQ